MFNCVPCGWIISINLLSHTVSCTNKSSLKIIWISNQEAIVSLSIFYLPGHEVEVVYHPDATYSLAVGGSMFLCSAHLRKDNESYIIHGNLGDSYFTANVAIINRTMYIFCGEQNYTMTLPLPEFFHDLGAQQVGGAKTPAYSSRVTKVNTAYIYHVYHYRVVSICSHSF